MTKSKRPNEHLKAQKKVKQVEGYKCAICRQVTNDAQGHHLIPYSRGGSSDREHVSLEKSRNEGGNNCGKGRQDQRR